jgi:glyoxylase-like metal-dependent hydrolase (beta-lactamase superfamily II)
VGFIPEWGVLLAGDTVETPFPVVNDDSPVSQWITSLEHWRDNPKLQTVIPAHGPPGGRELLENNISYLKNLLKGQKSDLPDTLTDFYKETHEANVKHIADQNPSG